MHIVEVAALECVVESGDLADTAFHHFNLAGGFFAALLVELLVVGHSPHEVELVRGKGGFSGVNTFPDQHAVAASLEELVEEQDDVLVVDVAEDSGSKGEVDFIKTGQQSQI